MIKAAMSITAPNLAGLDLNLLLVFDAVMQERNVTRAATRVGMSQPAVSAALSRLRHHMRDELFVRVPVGVRPTPRAVELAMPIRHALAELQQALNPAMFSPAEARHRFGIVMDDYLEAVLLPQIAGRLAREAPAMEVRVLPGGTETAAGLLDSGAAEFAAGAFDRPAERFAVIELFVETLACVMRKGHPYARKALTLEAFAGLPQLIVAVCGLPQVSAVDAILQKRRLTRQVGMIAHSVLAVPSIIANSDMVALLPERLARRAAGPWGLVIKRAPLNLQPSTIRLMSLRRLGRYPAHQWFGEMIADVAAKAQR